MKAGERLLAQLEAEARATGVQELRLDVAAANAFLAPYYCAQGFDVVARGVLKGDGRLPLQARVAALLRARRFVRADQAVTAPTDAKEPAGGFDGAGRTYLVKSEWNGVSEAVKCRCG